MIDDPQSVRKLCEPPLTGEMITVARGPPDASIRECVKV